MTLPFDNNTSVRNLLGEVFRANPELKDIGGWILERSGGKQRRKRLNRNVNALVAAIEDLNKMMERVAEGSSTYNKLVEVKKHIEQSMNNRLNS
ncbi:hypothetical protein [Shimazuella alba]|uniref:Uncharacterized protein n=1 Tax=Shimazuella alba TaxID=2690964 RepID=A0A6I4VWG6_9BACL|nr:hypothetical protein [Shimazuella alba]MXQ54948.1 hypothetical protein [Shimazuella alba]